MNSIETLNLFKFILMLSTLISKSSSLAKSVAVITLLAITSFAITRFTNNRKPARTRTIPPHNERVLILGASSGLGATLAKIYAARGAAICLVGRRKHKLEEVEAECRKLAARSRWNAKAFASPSNVDLDSKEELEERRKRNMLRDVPIFHFEADITDAERMMALLCELGMRWSGLDTLVVCAGVSSTQPLLSTAGITHDGKAFLDQSVVGLRHAISIANTAMHGNFLGPFVAAIVLIPLLINTSRSPSILLISSIASLIPAPTRSLYAATKSASLLLYQSLAIEHSEIRFTFAFPSTIEGAFRARAIDVNFSDVDETETPGLSKEYVATRCIDAVDRGKRNVFIKKYLRFGHLVYWMFPSYIEKQARQKYNYESFDAACPVKIMDDKEG